MRLRSLTPSRSSSARRFWLSVKSAYSQQRRSLGKAALLGDRRKCGHSDEFSALALFCPCEQPVQIIPNYQANMRHARACLPQKAARHGGGADVSAPFHFGNYGAWHWGLVSAPQPVKHPGNLQRNSSSERGVFARLFMPVRTDVKSSRSVPARKACSTSTAAAILLPKSCALTGRRSHQTIACWERWTKIKRSRKAWSPISALIASTKATAF